MISTLNFVVRPILLVILVASACSAMAAERVNLATTAAKAGFGAQSIHSMTGLGTDELIPLRSKTLNGHVFTRYQQFHHGVPVFGEAIVAKSDAGALSASTPALSGVMLNNLIHDLPSVSTKVDHQTALQQAKTLSHAQGTSNDQVKLYIKQSTSGVAHLFYMISFINHSATAPSRPFYMIDANSGAVLAQWEGINHVEGKGPGGNAKTGQYEYQIGGKYGPLDVVQSGSTCTLDSANVATYNYNGSAIAPSGPWSFTCPRNTNHAVNDAFAPMNDAHFFGNVVFNMYKDYLNLRPISQKLAMRVHYANAYENAFWDGTAMHFGDGANTFYPLVSLDVAAHEVSHGFTEQNSGLIYTNMSGGMNEAFSDMAGEAAEFYARGSNDWLVGAEIVKNGVASRYFEDPTKDGKSIGHASKYTPGLNTHYSSGVYNRAYYNLAKTVGWDTKKAFQVMAHANDIYWTTNSTFDQGACGVAQAAIDFGYTVSDVTAAFNVVGVSCPVVPPVCNSIALNPGGLPASGGQALAQANCTGSAITYAWTFNGSAYGGNTSSISATIGANASTNSQSYPVCVTATNAGGSSSACTALTQAGAALPAPVCNSVGLTPSSLPASGGQVLAQASCAGTAITYTWALNGSAYGGNTSTISAAIAANASTNAQSYPVCVTATNASGSSRACASLAQAGKIAAVPTVTSNLNPAMVRKSVIFTATLAGSVTGAVDFLADGVIIPGCAQVALASNTATCATSTLKPGTRKIEASYNGEKSVPLLQVIRTLDWLAPVLDLLLND